MNTLGKILTGTAIFLSSLLPFQKTEAQEISGNVNAVLSNNYLTNGFSFDNNPTLFVNGSMTTRIGDTYLTALGIHSRNLGNRLKNGETSWTEWTGLVDASQDVGFGTVSIGAYYTALPPDVFWGIDGVNGIYGQFKTNTNPSVRIYADRGFKFVNGLMAKLGVSGSTKVMGKDINASAEFGAMNNYFIKKQGPHYLAFNLNSEILSEGPLNVSAGLKYQKGIGNKAITGLQGKLTAGVDF